MSDLYVLDASAVLAFLGSEPGREAVQAVLPGALVSTVNLAEVLSRLTDRGMQANSARALTLAMRMRPVDLDLDLAEAASALRPLTRAAGLSLGDRCCLALARHHGAVALTTDRAWAAVADAVGVEVVNIRPAS